MTFSDAIKKIDGWWNDRDLLKHQLRKLAIQIRHREDQLFMFLTLVIGAVVGLTTVAFIVLTENLGSRMYPIGPEFQFRRLLVPVIGSLVTGFLMYRYFPDARGSGIPQTKVALAVHGGRITLRSVLEKSGSQSFHWRAVWRWAVKDLLSWSDPELRRSWAGPWV